MRRRIFLAAVLALAAASAPARAHHGWGGYDSTKVLTLTGTIEQAAYANPHGELKLKVTAPQGKTWTVTLAPPFRMQSRGLPAAELKPGATVTVAGYPSKTDPNEMRAERITVNGKIIELR
ncbi:MAG: DUF6152 family protein [Rhodospirillales bacterium]